MTEIDSVRVYIGLVYVWEVLKLNVGFVDYNNIKFAPFSIKIYL